MVYSFGRMARAGACVGVSVGARVGMPVARLPSSRSLHHFQSLQPDSFDRISPMARLMGRPAREIAEGMEALDRLGMASAGLDSAAGVEALLCQGMSGKGFDALTATHAIGLCVTLGRAARANDVSMASTAAISCVTRLLLHAVRRDARPVLDGFVDVGQRLVASVVKSGQFPVDARDWLRRTPSERQRFVSACLDELKGLLRASGDSRLRATPDVRLEFSHRLALGGGELGVESHGDHGWTEPTAVLRMPASLVEPDPARPDLIHHALVKILATLTHEMVHACQVGLMERFDKFGQSDELRYAVSNILSTGLLCSMHEQELPLRGDDRWPSQLAVVPTEIEAVAVGSIPVLEASLSALPGVYHPIVRDILTRTDTGYGSILALLHGCGGLPEPVRDDGCFWSPCGALSRQPQPVTPALLHDVVDVRRGGSARPLFGIGMNENVWKG